MACLGWFPLPILHDHLLTGGKLPGDVVSIGREVDKPLAGLVLYNKKPRDCMNSIGCLSDFCRLHFFRNS